MLSLIVTRTLKLFFFGLVCSLPIYLEYFTSIPVKGILFLSFFAFLIATGIDTYCFSFDYWEKRYFFIGTILPLAIYFMMSIVTYLLFPPVIFNRIFFPLRVALICEISTRNSIAVAFAVLLVVISLIRMLGARLGRMYFLKLR